MEFALPFLAGFIVAAVVTIICYRLGYRHGYHCGWLAGETQALLRQVVDDAAKDDEPPGPNPFYAPRRPSNLNLTKT